MQYKRRKPCKSCPFRSSTAFTFPEERAEEIVYHNGGFACHDTTTTKGRRADHKDAQACAGRLIVLEREEQPDQMMRIAERLGLYDRTKLDMENEDVFEDIESFMSVRVE